MDLLEQLSHIVPWRYLPSTELVRFKAVDFFPPPPDFSKLQSICIATKTRTIGDALALSTLPRKLKLKFPNLRITTYPRAFNPVVFYNNPAVSAVSYLPDQVYGDDCSADFGQLLELKENFFGVERDKESKPEIFLTQAEQDWAGVWMGGTANAKPICILHPWGHTWQKVAPPEYWAELVATHSEQWNFWQVGVTGHAQIPGCQRTFLSPLGFWNARKLFALMEHAQAFIGVNSGPMHIARAFEVRSLVLTEEGDITSIFATRRSHRYYLKGNHAHAFLYESNRHLNLPAIGLKRALQESTDFLSIP